MKKSWTALAAITLLGFLARLAFLRFEYVINPDGAAYTRLAESLAAGNWTGFLDPYWSPLYPLLIAPATIFTGDVELPGRLVSIIFGSLLPIPVFLLVRQIYGETEALAAAALTAFYGHYLNFAQSVTPSALYFFIFAFIVYFGRQTLWEAGLTKAVTLGAFLGLGYLTRPEAIGYLPIFAVLLWSGFFCEEPTTFKKRSFLTLALILSFLIIALPYLIYLREATGHWTVSAKLAPHLMGGNFSEISALGESRTPPDTFVGRVGTAFSTLVYNFQKQHKFFSYLFPPGLIFLAALGLGGEKWTRGRRKNEIYLLLLFLATFAAYLVTVVELAYMAAYLGILFGWTAIGIGRLYRWLGENFSGAGRETGFKRIDRDLFFAAGVILAIVYGLPVLGIFRNPAEDREYNWREVKTAGLWLEKNVAPRPKIMSFAVQIPFYARGEHIPLRGKTPDELLPQAKTEGVDLIVISERTEKDLPGIQDWLAGTPNSPEVKEIYRDETRAGCKLIVYQVIK
jgi:4-amino-4-deoxy-L-arabinose transferase-like glycosyltransferase